MGNTGQAAYSASKAGLIGLTKSLAVEYGPRGITVNAVAPGYIDTEMLRDVRDKIDLTAIPLRRLGQQEVADAVSFLVGSDYLTGQVIVLDGGLSSQI
ncbi:3ketoacyl-(acyl-carrier-protein) reductase [Acanthamoeba castellanii str. Neff]|uniref:3ketoacyl-(Acyl-carrier-protein) reductase n=1 Tax=Acanthamoeba castellanii (strain ATCC 30010 / Neff) TaxID=1257118 RepID=L8GN04_ACACF|nr:3ketoacyl-(acyl-carrier-protein) reductase [Acanthamoeba castellanii str. Neff]ELR14372.1 3ketoacyl-(acyl-carrier-protein) reductase [Acanthamoeba castellanii str. Neff]